MKWLKKLLKPFLNEHGSVSNGMEETVTKEGEDSNPDGTSPGEKEAPPASTGDGKHGSGAGQERSDFVPRKRFDEVYSRAKTADELEEALSEHKDRLYRDPVSGKLKLRIEAPKQNASEEEDEDEKDDLTEDEKLVFDDLQWKAIEKRLARLSRVTQKNTTKSVFSSYQEMVRDQDERKSFLKEASDKFPDLFKEGAELNKEYDRLIRSEYAQKLKNGKLFIPPRAILDAAIKANWILKEREEKKAKDLKESEKMNTQNSFVSKTTKSAPERKGKLTDAEFAELSDEDQRAYMEQEFEKNKENL